MLQAVTAAAIGGLTWLSGIAWCAGRVCREAGQRLYHSPLSLDVEQVDHQRTFAIPAPLARAKRGFGALERAPKVLEGSLGAK
jgi:hypothetical protein